MSMDNNNNNNNGGSEQVCYVQCTLCSTILAVSVPCCNMYNSIVTVRCGHCANLLSVNFGPSPFPPTPHFQEHAWDEDGNNGSNTSSGSSSPLTPELTDPQPRLSPIRPPEKRQRVPSAYNKFIKEEIQRIKACNPEISHREAFSAAAKNWAHFPHIQFGIGLSRLDTQIRESRMDQPIAGDDASHAFY